MIYYQDEDVLIRDMEPADGLIFTEEEIAQGWHATVEKYEQHLKDRAEGRCVSLTAEYRGNPAGYINVYNQPVEGPFVSREWPEINDFGVLQKSGAWFSYQGDRRRARGHGVPVGGTAQRLRQRPKDVREAGLYSGRFGCMVQWQALHAL